MANENVVHLTEETFDNGIAKGLTLVDFWAEWCAPCLMLGPLMDQLADEFPEKLTVAKVHIESNPNVVVQDATGQVLEGVCAGNFRWGSRYRPLS